MPQKDTSEIKQKIISAIEKRGPSLPIHISKEIEMSTLFTSAFLSELLSSKKIKITNMKVGNSPIYYLSGQEKQLEPFSEYLKNKEKEAFMLLKEKRFLKDKNQEPAIRVALRSIKDFAKSFQNNENELWWRYFLIPEEEFYSKKKEKANDEEGTEKKEETKPANNRQEESKNKEEKVEEKKHNIFDSDEKSKEVKKEDKTENPETKKKPSNKKEKPEFVKEVLDYLNKNNINTEQEISFKKKEYQAIIKVNSDIGPVDFFLLAKGKKKISTDDVIDVINEAKKQKLYGLLLYSEEIQNKAEDFARDNSQILKIKKIE